MNRYQIEYIRDMVTATLWHINDRVSAGENFLDVKKEAIKKMMATQKFTDAETREGLWNMLVSLEVQDLSKTAMAKIKADNLTAIEKFRGRKAGRIERLFYNITGMVWRV